MLIIVFLLSWLAGHLTVAALRSPAAPWRMIDLFWGGLIGLAATSWLGQILADLGWFHLLIILGAPALYISVLALRLRDRSVPRGLHGNRRDMALLGGVLLIGAALFFWPAETPVGGRDDGIRVLAGATVAREGGWLRHSPLLADLPLYRGTQGDLKYLGFLVWDAGREIVVPQFTGAHEVWQAIAWGLADPDLSAAGGIRAAHPWMFFLNPLLALGALIACYALGRQLFSRNAALLGTLLLAINVAQVWYARQTMGEILLQTLLLGGSAASIAYLRAPDRVTALAAGMAFGVALLTKVDAVIAVGVLVGVLLLVWPQRRAWPFLRWLGVPLGLAIAQYTAHSAWFSANYFGDNISNMLNDRTLLIVMLLGAAGVATVAALRRRFRERINAVQTRPLPRWLRVAALGGLLLLIGYAYVVRPTVLAQESYVHIVWNTRFFTYRGLNFVLLVAYLTPIAFGLALIGLTRLALHDFRWYHWPFLGMVLGYGIVFTYNAMIVGDQPFWVRRFLPVVIPGALLLAGAGLAQIWSARNRWRRLAPLLLLITIGWSAWQTAPIAALRSGAGLSRQTAEFAQKIPANAVVLFQDWQAAFDLAAPLEVLYGVENYALTGELLRGAAAQQWQAQLAAWQRAGRPVVYVATSGALTITSDTSRWQPLDQWALRYRTIETTHDRLPAKTIEVNKALRLYTIVPQTTAFSCSTTIEVGGDDYGAIGPGFYDSEQIGPLAARWSKAAASIVLPRVEGAAGVTLTLYNGRPAELGAATLRISSGGEDVATVSLQPGWHDYAVPLPASIFVQPAPILLDLNVPTWSPQQVGQPDGRELGVMVDKFSVRQKECIEP